MTAAPGPVLARMRQLLGTPALPRFDPAAVRLILRALLFHGHGVPDWHEHAVCREADPDLFFPDDPNAVTQAQAAKQVCARCPVQAECLTDVLAWERPGDRHGIAGGLSPAERHPLARQHRKEGQAA